MVVYNIFVIRIQRGIFEELFLFFCILLRVLQLKAIESLNTFNRQTQQCCID
jgi:hypothetical protein